MLGRNFAIGEEIIISNTMYCPGPMPRQAKWGNKKAKVLKVELYEDRLGWIFVECEGKELMLDEREIVKIEEK